MAALQEKRKRTTELSNFTRNLNKLNKLFDAAAPSVLVNPQFGKMTDCYERLEQAHNEYLAVTDVDIEADKEGLAYLNEPDLRHEEALQRYATYLKADIEQQRVVERTVADEESWKARENRKQMEEESRAAEELRFAQEQKRKFESGKAQLTPSIAAFKRMTLNVKETLTDISVVDKRQEWQKVESEFSLLKKQFVQVVGIDHSQDVSDITASFEKDAEKVFVDTQKQILGELKDVPFTSGGAVSSDSSSSVSSNSTIRKEAVQLPKFQGDENQSPYLKFPVWKKQWDVMIGEYDEQWRPGLLLNHVDESAQSKFVGYETNYNEAIKRLSLFYGDPMKVVHCVLKEVMSPGEISEGDYQGLIEFSVILENNFNRLAAMNLEHEISNSSAMSLILRKFPRSVGERWYDHLSVQSSELKLKPFPILIEWLKSRKEPWQSMAAVDVSRSSGPFGLCGSAFYGQERNPASQGQNRVCYGCGMEGHVRRSCPKEQRSESYDNQNDPPKKRKKPTVKRFWCALHKGERTCFSDSCQELRRTEVQKRIQLLKDNGDCFHCCGDHKSSDCLKKERVCGGGKEDRGCTRSHAVHELFCVDAKVFSIQHVNAMGVRDDSDGVVLLIMKVRSAKKGLMSSVFWDIGCTSNFVREDFAKRCGFQGHKEKLSVTTLGGVETDYVSVTTYKCSLLDANGQTEHFEAYGMETITGELSSIDPSKIRRLFPHLSEKAICSLQRGTHVDFLIGMSHPSWHPERAEKARHGGDFWLYRGRFGSCVGGRHKEIKEGTRRSDNLFTSVHQSYYVATQPLPSHQLYSHELEFCLQRCEAYTSAPSVAAVAVDMSVPTYEETCGWIENDIPCECVPALTVNENFEGMVEDVIPFEDQVESELNAGGCGNVENTSLTEEEFTSNSVLDVTVNESAMCYAMKATPLTDEDLFFQSQSLGTIVEPRCGGCKCSKCPIPGMKYSFKEQQEYDLIQKNLFYDEDQRRWFTEYPWSTERSALPRNEKAALQLLYSLERNLKKKPELVEEYCKQIAEMVERGAAIELSDEELKSWNGDYYYLPLLGVQGKKSLRVVFDASRRQCGCPSFNDCVCKGPERFINNILSVILGFRNGRVAATADLRKFHNQVHLIKKDVHMQRFLWRDLKIDEAPKTYAVTVNNFGVRSANCIATLESQELKDQTYVDDELVAAPYMEELIVKTQRMDEICQHANMPNKGWTFSGDKGVSGVDIGDEVDSPDEKVLGMSWSPSSDSFDFHVTLKLKTTYGEVSVSTQEELQAVLVDLVLTRRVLLANVSRIFDPIGFLASVLLKSKLLMRESWCGKTVGWDEPLPPDQQKHWLEFLSSLLALGDVKFARSLWPEEDVVGLPTLIIFSDGAILAFGATAYIRWELKAGGFWSRLIMAKCRIAPKDIVTVPRMELNGAVIGN